MTISDKLALLEQTKEAQRVKLGLPKSVPFSQYIKFMRAWTPSDLFANGGQGVWLDPSDLKTMFQNVNGLVPVTKDGDPVGLILDKSQGLGEYVALSSDEVMGDPSYWKGLAEGFSELKDGVFRNYKSYSKVSVESNSLKKGRMYRVDINVSEVSSSIDVYVKNSRILVLSKVSHYSFYVKSEEDGYVFSLVSAGNTKKGVAIDFLEITEIKGNHATQTTASARPICRNNGELHWLGFDGVDDTLTSQLPTGTYTEIKASRDGVTHKYPVNVNGSYALGDLTQTKQSVSGLVLVNRQLTQAEIVNVTNLMKVKAGLPL